MQQVATTRLVSLTSLSELGLASPEVTEQLNYSANYCRTGIFQICMSYKILRPRNLKNVSIAMERFPLV